MNDLDEFLSETSRIVDESLDAFIPSSETDPRRLHEAIRWSIFAGGKRFRPALLFAVGRVFSVPVEKLLRTASAVEMIHTYSLIHDDLPSMDNDDLRRGRLTCHKKFDEATAILAGDVLETLAFEAVAMDVSLSAEVRVLIIAELARAAGTPYGMVAGQQLDLEAEGKPASIAKIEQIHRLKTGALITACAMAGVIIAHGAFEERQAVSEYASNLGLLFQITDDLLDVTGTTEDLGKTAHKDVEAQKATYPSAVGIDETAAYAGRLCASAVAALEPLKRDTSLLADIARHILQRGS